MSDDWEQVADDWEQEADKQEEVAENWEEEIKEEPVKTEEDTKPSKKTVPAQPKPQTPNKGKKNKNIKSTEEPEAPLDKHEAEERSRASDYANTQDLFKDVNKPQVNEEAKKDAETLFEMKPNSLQEFTEYAKLFAKITDPYHSNYHYTEFLYVLNRELCKNITSEDVNRLIKKMNVLAKDKKQEESKAPVKKPNAKTAGKKIHVKVEQSKIDRTYEDDMGPGGGAYDDEYDFM